MKKNELNVKLIIKLKDKRYFNLNISSQKKLAYKNKNKKI